MGFFRKMADFLVYEDFVDIFWGSMQIWTIFRGHFYVIYGIHKVKVQNWNICWGLLKFKIFWGAPDIPDIFFR